MATWLSQDQPEIATADDAIIELLCAAARLYARWEQWSGGGDLDYEDVLVLVSDLQSVVVEVKGATTAIANLLEDGA